jgi:HSP20 family protein
MAEQAPLTGTKGTEQVKHESTRGGYALTPRVDVYETENELVLYADVPGVRAEDVELRYERGELTLHGRVRPRQRPEQYFQGEYEPGDFFRVFQVHESIDGSRITAECKGGVLTVHLPKAEAVRPRQVQVHGE